MKWGDLAMTVSNFIGSFAQFLSDNKVYIIVVAAVIIVFAIIVVVAVKRKKPVSYTPDEIDRAVDEAAEEKAALRKAQEREKESDLVENEEASAESEVQASTPAEEPCEKEEPQEETTKTVQEALETEEENEELTFEAADIEEPQEEKHEEQKTAAPQKHKTVSYRILYDRETKTWEVRKDNAKRVIRRVRTKREALEIAQELCQRQDLNLVVHKKDGKFQRKPNSQRKQ